MSLVWMGDDWDEEPEVPHAEVTERENPVVATLLGPDGQVLFNLRERRQVRFGYQK